VSGSAVACLFCLPESMDSGITSGSIESLFQNVKISTPYKMHHNFLEGEKILDPKPAEESIEQLTKQVAKGGTIAFGGSLIGKVFGFVLNIMLGRVLGPEGFGLYALGMSVMGITQSISSLGLSKGVVRFCATDRGKGEKAAVKGTILAALGVSTISSIVVSAIMFVFAEVIAQGIFNEPGLTLVLKVLALAIPFYVLMGITTSFAVAFRRIAYQQQVQNFFRPLITLLFVGTAFLLGFRLAGAVYGVLVSGLLSACLGLYFLWKLFPEILSAIKPTYKTKRLLIFSLQVLLSGFSYLLLNYTDRLMLGYFGKASDVGIYAAAGNMAMLLTVILSALLPIASPITADLYSKGNSEALSSVFRTVTRWAFTMTLPIFLIFFFSSQGIMSVYGPEFASGAAVLMILSVGQLVNVGTGPVGMLLEMTGKQKITLYMGLILVVVNIILNLWLIPLFGAIGAALATAMSVTAIFTILLFLVYRMYRIQVYDRYFIYPVIAGIMATIISEMVGKATHFILFGSLNIIEVAIIIIVYCIVLFSLGISKDDKVLLFAIKNKILGV